MLIGGQIDIIKNMSLDFNKASFTLNSTNKEVESGAQEDDGKDGIIMRF